MIDKELLTAIPPTPPQSKLIWSAIVDVEDRIDLGASALGNRYMVPIIGGRFYGGPDYPLFNGKVLGGGADRQLLRPDGVKELDAVYEMQADDGTILPIRNRVIVDDTTTPQRYAMSVITVTAPDGPFNWLNRRLIVGTLQSARPKRQAVIVRAWA